MAKSKKQFIGPGLRKLRNERGQTQMQMAEALDVSATYINLLENNQRSLSVALLLKLSDVYQIDWRDLVDDENAGAIAELQSVLKDPVFGPVRPPLNELRAALDHAPSIVRSLISLHRNYASASERLQAISRDHQLQASHIASVSPESSVHNLFRQHHNYFGSVEDCATSLLRADEVEPDELYFFFKRRLKSRHGLKVSITTSETMQHKLRHYDERAQTITLSDGMDHMNRCFQLAHMLGLIEYRQAFETIIADAAIRGDTEQARCRVELANYFAAAVLMPYSDFLREARRIDYDIDGLAARFGVSYEMVCHRLTTLQRPGETGVPFFFLRVDKAGNVTKRISDTALTLAQQGGACPVLDIHLSFRTPGRIIPQFVEMPDGARYFTINRTVDRPTLGMRTQDNRQASSLGCAVEFADRLVYAKQFDSRHTAHFAAVGTTCHACMRAQCSQRAYPPLNMTLHVDEATRGETRFES